MELSTAALILWTSNFKFTQPDYRYWRGKNLFLVAVSSSSAAAAVKVMTCSIPHLHIPKINWRGCAAAAVVALLWHFYAHSHMLSFLYRYIDKRPHACFRTWLIAFLLILHKNAELKFTWSDFSASLQKNTLFLAVLLTGTVSVILGMQIQVYQKGNADCEHCTTHQYDNTVTYNKHTSGPSGTTYYTEQRVVTTGGGGASGSPATISSAAYDSSVGSNNNQVIYEGTGNQTNFARISVTTSSSPFFIHRHDSAP